MADLVYMHLQTAVNLQNKHSYSCTMNIIIHSKTQQKLYK